MKPLPLFVIVTEVIPPVELVDTVPVALVVPVPETATRMVSLLLQPVPPAVIVIVAIEPVPAVLRFQPA